MFAYQVQSLCPGESIWENKAGRFSRQKEKAREKGLAKIIHACRWLPTGGFFISIPKNGD